MDLKQFILEVNKLGIEVNEEQLEKLEKYYDLLISYNEKMNLTAITDKKEVYLKHFYDSLTLLKVVDLNNEESLCDVGTGAGFPGIVLKIFYPHIKLTLVDSLNKRINFLKDVVSTLNLDNVICVHARAEEYAKVNREKFDIVTARAVASLNVLLEYCIPMVKKNKYFVAMKGHEDINLYEHSLKILDSKIVNVNEFLLPIEDSQRTIIKIEKLNYTNKKYPRKFSEIKKKPL